MFFFVFFLTQVSIAGQNAEGMGPSKKVAKRNAAEKMLELLGFKVPQPQPSKPALKTDEKVSVCLLTAFTLHQKMVKVVSGVFKLGSCGGRD